jgi:hypothetical protein
MTFRDLITAIKPQAEADQMQDQARADQVLRPEAEAEGRVRGPTSSKPSVPAVAPSRTRARRVTTAPAIGPWRI